MPAPRGAAELATPSIEIRKSLYFQRVNSMARPSAGRPRPLWPRPCNRSQAKANPRPIWGCGGSLAIAGGLAVKMSSVPIRPMPHVAPTPHDRGSDASVPLTGPDSRSFLPAAGTCRRAHPTTRNGGILVSPQADERRCRGRGARMHPADLQCQTGLFRVKRPFGWALGRRQWESPAMPADAVRPFALILLSTALLSGCGENNSARRRSRRLRR